MMKDKFVFLDLIGGINEDYINQSLLPWQEKGKWTASYQIWKQIAVFVLGTGIGLCCIFHTQVKATFEKLFTMIEMLLNNPNELLEYTKVIGSMLENDGVTLQLQEVVLSDEHITIGAMADAKGKEISIDVISVVINEEAITPVRYTSAVNSENESVIDWEFEDTIPINQKNIIEIEITVFCVEMQKVVPFSFIFTASNAELMNYTVYQSIGQNMVILDNEAGIESLFIKDIMLNSLHSEITLTCESDLMQDTLYYLVGVDSKENETYYSLSRCVEEETYIFENEFGVPDIESEWIDIQLYFVDTEYESGLENINKEDKEQMSLDSAEISGIYSMNKEELLSISEPLKIILD